MRHGLFLLTATVLLIALGAGALPACAGAVDVSPGPAPIGLRVEVELQARQWTGSAALRLERSGGDRPAVDPTADEAMRRGESRGGLLAAARRTVILVRALRRVTIALLTHWLLG